MQFSYNDYNAARSAAANTSVKVGWFKLAPDQEAVIRINLADLNDLQFANVHTVKTKDGKWMRISCLNHIGANEDNCDLCKIADDKDISKAAKKVYVQLLAAYKDPATGQFSAPVPVIWERAAGFSKELAGYIRDYGNLKEVLLKVTRNGSGLDTRYVVSYAIPTVYKPELVPADFSAFDNFHIEKHSYWEKSAEDIAAFVATGVFPEAPKAEKSDNLETKPDGSKVGGAPVFANAAEERATEAALGMQPEPAPAPAVTPAPTPAPVEQPAPAPQAEPEQRSFTGFKF